ncbi:MAG: hypothetical protein ACF8PN_10405 [Phycisphaerales bacterium]
MRTICSVFGFAAGAMALSVASYGQPIGWDDIPTNGLFTTPVPPAYLGHTWSGATNGGGRGYVDLLSAKNSGWFGTLPDISPPNVLFNGFGDDDVWVRLSSPMTLNGAFVTMWPNDTGCTSIRVQGRLSGNVVYDASFPLINDQWSQVSFSGALVDEIHFYRQNAAQCWWLMDDLDLGGGFNLAVSGSCPGSVTASTTGGTPGGQVAFVFGLSTGSCTIPSGPCAGTVLGLSCGGAQLVGTATANANGDASLSGNCPQSASGRFVQAIDVTGGCIVSNVVQLP